MNYRQARVVIIKSAKQVLEHPYLAKLG